MKDKIIVQYIGNELTYLLPGEMIVTVGPMKITTVLGSCISVCLYDRVSKIAGMNHYLLPFKKSRDDNRLKYGDTAMNDMLDLMLRKGALLSKIEARIYGGSSIFNEPGTGLNIGELNTQVALDFINESKIPLNHVETGGRYGRKVIFDTSAGVISSSILNSNLDNGG